MVTRKTICGLIVWMRKYGIKVDEQTFFQMAYFDVYQKAEPRCQLCFELYIKKGVVPVFVRRFITHHFILKGV